MHRLRSRSAVALVATGAALGLATSPAMADRVASKSERAAIKRIALARCGTAAPRPCKFRKARISTRSARYAWADLTGEGFSGVLLKRPRAHSLRFKVVGVQGGGIGECSYWRKRAPAAVLRDLDIQGLVDSSGATRSCG